MIPERLKEIRDLIESHGGLIASIANELVNEIEHRMTPNNNNCEHDVHFTHCKLCTRMKEIREYQDQCSKAHNMKIELLDEITRLREVNNELIYNHFKDMKEFKDALDRSACEIITPLREKLGIATEALHEMYMKPCNAKQGCSHCIANEALQKIKGTE